MNLEKELEKVNNQSTKPKEENKFGLAHDGYRVIRLAFLVIFLILTINTYIPSMCQHFINPEYPVYLQIIEMIKQIKK